MGAEKEGSMIAGESGEEYLPPEYLPIALDPPILLWEDLAHRREMRRNHNRIRRAEKQAERRKVTGQNQRAFSGRVHAETA